MPAYDPNLIFYIFAIMLGPAIIAMVVIGLVAQSNRRLRANGFGTTAYAVFWLGFSGWWFVLAVILAGTTSAKLKLGGEDD